MNQSVWFQPSAASPFCHTRSVTYENLVMPLANTELRRSSFPHRTVNIWNSLPFNVRVSGSVDEFKKSYDNYGSDLLYVL